MNLSMLIFLLQIKVEVLDLIEKNLKQRWSKGKRE
jgi:hypothetical protein